MPSRKHWRLRERPPPNPSGSAVDIQSFVVETVDVTAVVAAQLRAVSDFVVASYGSGAKGMVDHYLMIADVLDVCNGLIRRFLPLDSRLTSMTTELAWIGWHPSTPFSHQLLPTSPPHS